MRTRRGVCYPDLDETFNRVVYSSKRRGCDDSLNLASSTSHKRRKTAAKSGKGIDFFDSLPDDLVISILCKLSAGVSRPADFISSMLTCKRLNGLGLNPIVLKRASQKTFSVSAKNWSEPAHRFLRLCAESGNAEASYTLGMIRFYCLQNRGSGASLMAKAAISSHAPALYSLAVIQFNGSGGLKSDKDLRAGVALCARAAFLGHIDALREFGHCLQDGYGVRKNVTEGRRFLVQANARELAAVFSTSAYARHCLMANAHQQRPVTSTDLANGSCALLSDFGYNVPAPEPHPANKFLSEWFTDRGGTGEEDLRMCSHEGCGRPETRKHEFRRCSICGVVNYCSRACQALDWKLRHKAECVAVEQWNELEMGGGGGIVDGNGDVANGVGDIMMDGEMDGGDDGNVTALV